MKKVVGGKFILNDVTEKVIEFPETRDGNIKITFGGHEDGFVESIPLTSFEEQTGYYIQGLEPEMKVSPESLIKSFVNEALRNDFYEPQYDPKSGIVAAGVCKFANHRDVNMEAWFAIHDNSSRPLYDHEGVYTIHVSKSDGSKTINDKIHVKHVVELDDALNQAMEKLKSYVVNKVQILNPGMFQKDADREYSEDGYPKLKAGETLSDYFKQLEAPGGIVINSKGKYQAFHSYDSMNKNTVSGRTLSYETKDYKTLKGAVKYLASHHFDENGLVTDFIDAELEESFKEEIMRFGGLSTSSDCWGDGMLRDYDCGKIFIHPAESRFVDNFGYKADIKFVFTDEKTGKTYTETCPISDRWRDNGGGFARHFTPLYLGRESALRSGEITFDDDNRTVAEKMEYHVERVKFHEERADYSQSRIKEYEAKADSDCNYARFLKMELEKVESINKLIDAHKASYKELKESNEKDLTI
ncbi:hypothetical protein R7Q39_27195 [Vibrio sp. 947]|uniref:hypothetical protein n=1 Tax=Vibrio sp. 947 TaxID=3074619 RepID=UPI002963D31A|nr:hypothetical protein [Vibrio sp. 947]MDW1929075.1 hypothetical protein [Vibrio sp. 947]